MANLPPVTESSFETEVLKSDVPVVVDFSAEWCAPCKMLAPTLERLAQDYAGKVKFLYGDVDQVRGLAMQYRITSVPTLLFFKNGQVVGQMIGNRPYGDIAAQLDKLLEG